MNPLTTAAAAAAIMIAAAMPAAADQAEVVQVASNADVETTADRLVTAIEAAGATVMARIDHGAGARSVGADIGESQLIVFGNPKAGTPVMAQDRLAGLMLPLKMLVYQDADGKVWIAHEDIGARLGDLDGIDDNAEVIAPLSGALAALSKTASGQQ